jgi:hypothetical protein
MVKFIDSLELAAWQNAVNGRVVSSAVLRARLELFSLKSTRADVDRKSVV